MVEEVIYKPDEVSKKQRKEIIIGFYLWNFNLYLITLLSFESIIIKTISFFILNTFVFRSLFGFHRFNRVMFWQILITILFIKNYGWVSWRSGYLAITTLINIGYYLLVIDNGKFVSKAVN